jgi:hypothetical protein
MSPTLQLRRKQQQGGLANAISGMHVGELYNITTAPLPHQLLHGLLQVWISVRGCWCYAKVCC